MLKKYSILILFFTFMLNVNAQKIDSLTYDTLKDAEIRLGGLAHHMVTSLDEITRINSGRNFIKMLSRTLKINNSYFYKFDSLKNVSIVYAPDNYFRIITWNVASDDEHFRNFGVIQMNPTKIKREEWIEQYFVQEVAYACMYFELTGIPVKKLITIMVTPAGVVKIFDKRDKMYYIKLLTGYIKEFVSDKLKTYGK